MIKPNYQDHFLALTNKAYFNYGGQGPIPQSALNAIHQAYDYIQTHGPFSLKINQWINQHTELTRNAIATLLSVPPKTITLTENVTSGCNIALWGIDWQKSQRILISDCEHPGVIAIIKEIATRFDLEIDYFPLLSTLNQPDPIPLILEHIKPNTRLLLISHILWNTGQLLPLASITQSIKKQFPNTLILVDAAQSVGQIPLKLEEEGIDFYAFTGHKWLCGPEGVGGLYINQNTPLSPTFIGWRGLDHNKTMKSDGRKYEVATSAYPLYIGLQQAIAFHDQIGTKEERYQTILEQSKILWEQLKEIPSITCLSSQPPQSGLVSFTINHQLSHQQIVELLEAQNIYTRILLYPNCIRACVHYFTLPSEIEQLIAALRKI